MWVNTRMQQAAPPYVLPASNHSLSNTHTCPFSYMPFLSLSSWVSTFFLFFLPGPPLSSSHSLSLSPSLYLARSLGILIKLGCSLMLSPWQQSPWRGWVCTLSNSLRHTQIHTAAVTQTRVHARAPAPHTLAEIIKGSWSLTLGSNIERA